MNINFFTPITFIQHPKEKKTKKTLEQMLIEGFDDYFFLGGKKVQIIKLDDPDNSYTEESKEQKSNVPLNILKVISYCTIAIPLIMLIGKAIARARFHKSFDKKIIRVSIKKKTDEAKAKKIVPKKKETEEASVNAASSNPKFVDMTEETTKVAAGIIKPEDGVSDPVAPTSPAAPLAPAGIEPGNMTKAMGSLREILGERGFFNNMKSQLEVMKLDEFLENFIEEDRKMVSQLRATIDDFIENYEDIPNQIERICTEVDKDQIDVAEIKKITTELGDFFLSDHVENYFHAIKRFSSFEQRYAEALKRKIDGQTCQNKLRMWLEKKFKDTFDPATIPGQRLMRHKDLLENAMTKCQRIDVETPALSNAFEKIKSFVESYNREKDIELCKGYIERYKKVNKWGPRGNNTAEREKLLRDIKFIVTNAKSLYKDIPECDLELLGLYRQLIQINEKYRLKEMQALMKKETLTCREQRQLKDDRDKCQTALKWQLKKKDLNKKIQKALDKANARLNPENVIF